MLWMGDHLWEVVTHGGTTVYKFNKQNIEKTNTADYLMISSERSCSLDKATSNIW